VSPGFFAPLDAPSVSGRDFIDDDGRNSDHAVIVNQSLAQRTFPSVDADRSPTAGTVPFTAPRPTASCWRSSRPAGRRQLLRHPRPRDGALDRTRIALGARVRHYTFGSEGNTIEELVAELGAAFLCTDLALTLEPREEHAAYIANWLDVLEADNRAIFTAASHAQRAADSINGPQPAASAG
jgi:hypothetical protein